MKPRFEGRYLLTATLVLAMGILIATIFRQVRFIRGSVSDIIATMFVFFSVLSFFRIRHINLALLTFGFACLIEFGQYIHFADRLGLKRGSIFSILLGNSFSFMDTVYYAIGVCISIILVTWPIKERYTQNA